MAERMTVVSDVSDTPGARPFNFAVESDRFVVDLTEDERAALEAILAPYIAVARKDPRRRVQRRGDEQSRIRDWARARGYQVAPRGRISQEILDEWDLAHPARDDSDDTSEAVPAQARV